MLYCAVSKLSDYRKLIKELLEAADPQAKLAEDFNLGTSDANVVLNSKAFKSLRPSSAPPNE